MYCDRASFRRTSTSLIRGKQKTKADTQKVKETHSVKDTEHIDTAKDPRTANKVSEQILGYQRGRKAFITYGIQTGRYGGQIIERTIRFCLIFYTQDIEDAFHVTLMCTKYIHVRK